MNYKLVNGKYVFNKSGVNFALSPAQVTEMRYLLEHIDAADYSSYIKREDCLKRIENIRGEFVGEGQAVYETRIDKAIDSLKD